jgi:hypothetical protein
VFGATEMRKLQFQQWDNIKFCAELGKSTGETFQMIKQVYGKEPLGCSAVFKWLFVSSGIVHTESIPDETTLNEHNYKEILFRLCSAMQL